MKKGASEPGRPHKPSGKAPSGDGANLVFSGFSRESKASLPLAEATALMLRQYLAMELSEDPGLSAAGRAAFDRAVYLLVATQVKPIVDQISRSSGRTKSELQRKAIKELAIRTAYASLTAAQRGREATELVAKRVRLSANTVRPVLDQIRAEDENAAG